MSEHKADLRVYLQRARDAMIWKMDGLSEYDVRRPLVSSGTNLLGLVKHLSGVEAEYFGMVFDRPFPQPLPWAGHEDDPNEDMWATPDESRASIVARYAQAIAHADRTLDALDLEVIGHVPWWPVDACNPTLHRVLIHVTAETQRHAGHADIVRELIDERIGLSATVLNVPDLDLAAMRAHHDRIEAAARQAAGPG